MKDPKRLLPAILFCSFAFALWPSQAAAQHRDHPVRPGGSAVVAVHPSFSGGATPVPANEPSFIAEPQVDALWRITGWLRLDAGVGYRAVGGADLLHEQLRGVSSSIALRFGGL